MDGQANIQCMACTQKRKLYSPEKSANRCRHRQTETMAAEAMATGASHASTVTRGAGLKRKKTETNEQMRERKRKRCTFCKIFPALSVHCHGSDSSSSRTMQNKATAAAALFCKSKVSASVCEMQTNCPLSYLVWKASKHTAGE